LTELIKPPEQASKTPNQGNSVNIVKVLRRSTESQPDKNAPFQVGERVTYRVPKIKSPKNYQWIWQTGTVKEINHSLELVMITPVDSPKGWIGIPFMYVQTHRDE
jgi:hypothetical protein